VAAKRLMPTLLKNGGMQTDFRLRPGIDLIGE